MDTIDNQEMHTQNAISSTAKQHMLNAARWMKFCAIIGFIFAALMVVIALAMPQVIQNISSMPGGGEIDAAAGIITVVYLIIALLFLLPNLFLYQSAVNFSRYVNTNMDDDIAAGFRKLHSLYLFIGIIFIIYLALILIAILGALVVR
jgi:hypothetical protein